MAGKRAPRKTSRAQFTDDGNKAAFNLTFLNPKDKQKKKPKDTSTIKTNSKTTSKRKSDRDRSPLRLPISSSRLSDSESYLSTNEDETDTEVAEQPEPTLLPTPQPPPPEPAPLKTPPPPPPEPAPLKTPPPPPPEPAKPVEKDLPKVQTAPPVVQPQKAPQHEVKHVPVAPPKDKKEAKRSKPQTSTLSKILSVYDDDDDVTITSNESIRTRSNHSLHIDSSELERPPDDELLFVLTKNEEQQYRRSTTDLTLGWSVEQENNNIFPSTDAITDTDTEDSVAAQLWDRIGPSTSGVPTISLNEKKISLSHLNPQEGLAPEEKERSVSYQNIFQEGAQDDSSDSNKEIYKLLGESARRKTVQSDESRKYNTKAKLWRRRLTVVILLHFLIRYRRKFVTINELFVPILVFGVLMMGMLVNTDVSLQSLESKSLRANKKDLFDPFDRVRVDSLFHYFCSNGEYCGSQSDRHYFIVYSPINNFTRNLMLEVMEFLELPVDEDTIHDESVNKHSDELAMSHMVGVETADDVETLCQTHWKNENNIDLEDKHKLLRYPIGIIFSFDQGLLSNQARQDIEDDKEIPRELSYTIRTHYNEIANTVEGFPFNEKKINESISQLRVTPYITTGIIGMQLAIDLSYAKKIVGKSGNGDLQIGRQKINRETYYRLFIKEPALKLFTYPTYKARNLRIRGWVAITMLIILSYAVGDLSLSQLIVREQQSGSIELLKIHGMTTGMRWVAYLIITGILRGVTSLVIALIIHFNIAAQAVSSYSSPFFLWLFLWMHGVAVTCFNYFITTGINKPELAGLVALSVGFSTMLVPLHLFDQGYLTRLPNMVLCFLFPQWNLANGIYYYMRYEIYEEGLDWYDFPVMDDGETHKIISLPLCCNVFLYSTMLYLSLTIYMDHIMPREFSPRESWLYCCRTFWRKPPSETSATRPIPKAEKPTVYEPGHMDRHYGPRLRNVTLTDPKSHRALLDNISVDIYEGEVTCVVGQTGSGKSNFLNVIAGVNRPSIGFVDVKGLKVQDYHDITCRYVSLCPQKQLLIETLSVEDHIRLCCMLHGASYAKAKTQASFLLQMFSLSPMRRHSYKGLSPSNIKKLLVSMALSKSPSVLLLDNPVDQLDAEATFQFWKLLQELKPKRSIIVTCTTLEDALLYGDRIAVLSKGKLLCFGTPSYLKRAYEIGGIISFLRADTSEPNKDEIRKLMDEELKTKTIPYETKGLSLANDEVKFILPTGKFYGSVIERLEGNMELLGISKVSISQPSLWALFYQMSKHSGIEQVLAKNEARVLKATNEFGHPGIEKAAEPTIPVHTGDPDRSYMNMGTILVLKKIWYYRQKHKIFLVAYLPQIILVIMMAYHARMFLAFEPESLATPIDTRIYTNNFILVRSADDEHTREGWTEAFRNVLEYDDDNIHVEMLGYSDDIEERLRTGIAHTLTQFKKQTIVAFSKDTIGFTGYYSSNSIHSAPIATHIMMQAFLYIISPNQTENYKTHLTSHPFPRSSGIPAGSTQSNSKTILGVFLSVILTLLNAPVIRLVLVEKQSKFKLLQRMAGVPAILYWFCHGIGDTILYVLLTFLCCAIIFIFDGLGWEQFKGDDERLAILYIFALWLCWAAIPYVYFLSQVVSIHSFGYGYCLLYHFLFGVIPKIVTYQLMRLQFSWFGIIIRYMLYLLPPYSLTSACIHYFHIVGDEQWCKNWEPTPCKMYEDLVKLFQENKPLSRNQQTMLEYVQDKIKRDGHFRTCCKTYCTTTGTCHKTREFFPEEWEFAVPGLQADLVALFIDGIVYWVLVILMENDVLENLFHFLSSKLCGNLEKTVAARDTKTREEPEDVKEEHEKVDFMVEIEGDVESEVYLVQDVTKFYKYTKGLDHIFFSVPVNAITGILGMPRSGKTTLLQALTHQITPSSGYIYKDNDLLDSKSKNQLLQNVGYFPRDSYMLPYLTGTQLMLIMGRLRGLSASDCKQHANWWLECFGLKEVANKKCKNYRAGESKRLACALTLIGDSAVLIYDEPTSEMDSLERYTFWNIMSKMPALNRTVLFTSTDADEIQHQSNKVLLLESGSFVAVGHLKGIFKNHQQGMFLAIRYGISSSRYTEYQKKVKIDKMRDHIIQYLSPCALLDEQDHLLIYHLKDLTMKLSRVYAVMETAKVKFISILEHFQVFEPTLDDIILQFHKTRIRRQEKNVTDLEHGKEGTAASETDF